MRPEDKHEILSSLSQRLLLEMRGATPEELRQRVADSIFLEQTRLKDVPPSRARRQDELFWRSVRQGLGGDLESQRGLLQRIVDRYAQEICGHFNERVYQAATRVLPPTVGLLLNAVSPKRLWQRLPELPSVDNAVILQGATEHLRRLHELGTVIVAPTHVSNLDSLVLGYAIYRLGLPPLVYGAGLNLFSNPMMSYFMHNLGAYTVDRRKKDPLYKRVLKEYATLTLEHGYDNLFFPGGTRSRSGAVESSLKLGLAGCGLRAYINNLRRGATRPKIFIVPATLSYQLVLEAETLIDDFLKEVGRSRYIITDDEFAQPRRLLDFARQLMALDSKIYLTFCRGMDPFGNPVDDDGESLDPKGRKIDIARYVFVDGEPAPLQQRDEQFTRELGDELVGAYRRNSMIQATNVTARAVLELLREVAPSGIHWVRFIRSDDDVSLDLRAVYRRTARLLRDLRVLSTRGEVRLQALVQGGDAEDVVAEGLRHFATYHRRQALIRWGDQLVVKHRPLLLYYQNRLEGYGLEATAGIAVNGQGTEQAA